eukprot:gene2719-2969_t
MSASLHSPLNKFIGSQRDPRTAKPAKVPFFGPQDDPWIALTGKNPEANKLKDPKRKQLLGILEKERNKERRERITYVLTQRMIRKYGSKYSAVISFLVEEFVTSSKEALQGSGLEVLEKEILNAIRLKDEELANQRSARNQQNSNSSSNKASDNLPSISSPSAPKGQEWQLLQVYQSIQEEEEDRMKREKSFQNKVKFRQALDDQIRLAAERAKMGDADEQRYVKHIKKDIVDYYEEQQRKKEILRKKNEEELRIRRAQIEDLERRALAEQEAIRLNEERNKRLLEEAAEREAQAIQQARQREAERQKLIERENAENKRLREEEKRREAAQDQQLMREYAAKLDREATEREQAFHMRMKGMEIKAAKYETEGAGKALREEQLKFEQMLLREQQRKEAVEREKERRKAEERARTLREALNENQRQLAQREAMKEEVKRGDADLRAYFDADMDNFNHDLAEQRRKRREAQGRYRQQLDGQVDELRRTVSQQNNMARSEKVMNASTLRSIEDDPQLLSKVLHRLRISKSRGACK